MRTARTAFTMVELLVVVAVLGLMLALVVPAVGHGMAMARGTRSVSNLRQLGTGLMLYAPDWKGHLPAHAYPAPPTPRVRWADAIWPYMSQRQVYLSPNLSTSDRARMLTPFAHDPDQSFGGYGYNYQYLGNGRHDAAWPSPYDRPFHARLGAMITQPARTVSLCDTDGCKAQSVNNAAGDTMDSPWSTNGVYAADPPLASRSLGSRGCRRSPSLPGASGNYGYQGGADGVLLGEGGATASVPGDPVCRATPSPRNLGKIGVLFLDGHADPFLPQELDDANGDGQVDNGLWNGRGRANVR
jgi:prepilin-type N-terminal cleavage/methylation domain-containing protein/prepilin-type processing-associated H-X9-DG protein